MARSTGSQTAQARLMRSSSLVPSPRKRPAGLPPPEAPLGARARVGLGALQVPVHRPCSRAPHGRPLLRGAGGPGGKAKRKARKEGGRRKSSRRAASLGLRCARNLILLRCLGRLGLLLLGLGLRRLSLELGSLGLFLVRRGRLLCGLLLRGSGLLGL
ncbi:unnamed protein product [Prorocentrum cordatum]|uniref:Uncharacterized protein n=1 Tax=Prorocentrum cordatum TaxID=2364126 RepID=A0ABN9Q8Q7_9DINO|nr:unnamed protein product [Polarella glacialis]